MADKGKLSGPRIVVEPPGPRSRSAIKRKERFVTVGLGVSLPAVIDRADGPFLQDVDGNVYLDFTVGLGALNCGHRPKEVVHAWKRQIDKFDHICAMVSMYEPYLRLAEELSRICPGHLGKSLIMNSGSEAIENSVKIAKAYNRKRWLVSYVTGYHGRTYLGLSLMGKEKPFREGFGSMYQNVKLVDFAYCYRCPLDLEYPSCGISCTGLVEEAVTSKKLKDDVCCLVMEPVQGAGGFLCPPPGYWEQIRRICDDNGIILIDDEIQTGFGRTGRLFAIEHWKVEPDIVVTGKSLSMGLPIGAVTGRDEIMSAPTPASLGGTYGGSPICCAGALEAIKLAKRWTSNAKMIHSVEKRRFEEWESRFEEVGDARGLGAMMAIELVRTKKGKEPAPELARKVQLSCFKKGLYVSSGGYFNSVLRLHPPLTITRSLLETGLDILERALKEETKSR
ncbi:MAG: aspartate aminotransferase family protein [Thermoplasmata archaeon]|nr:aspartate aminotransferase family protein [Thermoplasmata archaeon]